MGAFAVGAVRHIYRAYRESGWFSIVGGTSTGALIAPFAALLGAQSLKTAQEAMETLVRQYSEVKTADILERKNVIDFVKMQDCLYKSTPLRKRIDDTFRNEMFDLLKQDGMPYCYVAYTNFRKGSLEYASPRDKGMSRERFIDAMMASASVPVVMEPTVIDGDECFDGGIRDVLPISKAIGLGAEAILPIVLNPETVQVSEERFRRLDKVLYRTLDIMIDENCRNDLQIAVLINLASRARRDVMKALKFRPLLRKKIDAVLDNHSYRRLYSGDKRFTDIIEGLRPDQELTDNSLRFDPAQMKRWMEMGEEKAGRVLKASPF